MASLLGAVRKVLGRGKERRAEEIAADAAEEIEMTASIVLCDYLNAEEAVEAAAEIRKWAEEAICEAVMRKMANMRGRDEEVRTMLSRAENLPEKINDIREAFMMHCDEADKVREKVASLLEDAARSIQFCNDIKEVVEVLASLLSEVAKTLR